MTLEQTINDAIRNGHKIMEGQLGTILPTAKSMAAGERHAAKMEAKRAKVGAAALSDCTLRVVGGERQYHWRNFYAIVGQTNQIKWFEKRADGEYRIQHDPR